MMIRESTQEHRNVTSDNGTGTGSDSNTGELFNEGRLVDLMVEAELDCVIASAPHHVTYLSGFDGIHMTLYPQLEHFAVYERAGGRISLVMPIDSLDVHLERTIRADEVWCYGTWNIAGEEAALVPDDVDPSVIKLFEARKNFPWRKSAGAALVDLIKSRGLPGARVGVDFLKVGPLTRETLFDSARCSLVAGEEVLLAARMVKTEEEVRRLRRACALVEAAFVKAGERATRGNASEADLWAAARMVWAEGGAEPGHWETCVGTRTVGFFAPSRRAPVRSGDVIRFEAGCRLDSYFADCGRTAVLGRPSRAVIDTYGGLRAAIEEGISFCAPGVATSALYRRVMREMRKHVADYEIAYVGHGIGLEMYDPPFIAERPSDIYGMGADAILEEGMVVNLEVPYQHYGLGGLQLEESLLITKTGAVPLNTTSRALWRLDEAGVE